MRMRNHRLDILRGAAVLLVLLRHSGWQAPIAKVGWVGVDLFFVLSGYLVSGLVFDEYVKYGAVSFRRFLWRRALRIYPPFYAMLVLALLLFAQRGWPIPVHAFVCEGLYIQNYGNSLWGHTWSLAVEEQFYLLLAGGLYFLLRRGPWQTHVGLQMAPGDVFRRIPLIFGLIAISCLAVRVATVCGAFCRLSVEADAWRHVYFQTHTRLDALAFGVFLSFVTRFRRDWLAPFTATQHRRTWTALCASALVVGVTRFPLESRFMTTVGFSFLYLAFGGFVLFAARGGAHETKGVAWLSTAVGKCFAALGVYSYSIYLWHVPFNDYAAVVVRRIFHWDMNVPVQIVFFITGGIAIGIVMALLVELPVLRLRDRYWPSSKRPRSSRHLVPVLEGQNPSPI